VIQSRRWGWARHVAHMGDRRGGCRVLMGRPERRHHLEDLGIDGLTILNGFSRNGMGMHGLDCCGSG